MNKGIIVIGSSGSGKTTFLNKLHKQYKELDRYKWINSDFFVEEKEHEFYNNPLKAANHVKNHIIPILIRSSKDFIWDTTGANIKLIKKLIEENPDYEFKLIINYCHPLICFIRNFKRERKVPKQVIFHNWLKVYSQIEDYVELFGEDNIYIHEEEYSNEDLKIIFSKLTFEQFINDFSKNNDLTSSFKKDSTVYSTKEIYEKAVQFINIVNKVEQEYNEIENIINNLDYNGRVISINIEDKDLYKWILSN